MTKISLTGVVWLASDIHLGAQTPETRRAFHAFLEQARSRADALILCGDIFDVWIGDDFATLNPPPWLDDTLHQLKLLAGTIPLWIGRGNRDFLIGEELTRYLGAELLPDVCRLNTDYGDVLLSHGDEYCLYDTGYQRFRRFVHNRLVQRLFLSLSLAWRRKIAAWARQRSQASNRYKSTHIMDVTPAAIEQAFTRTGVATMVHGHTHRPAIHRMNVGSRSCTRIVLPDWDYDHGTSHRGGWLTLDAHGPRLESHTT